MRRTIPDRHSRLPAARGVLVPRSRLAPLALALPLVLGLLRRIGLPSLAEVSGTAGAGGPMRDFLFGAAATGGPPGSGGGGRGPGSSTVAAAIVDPKIVREVRLERIRQQTTVYISRRSGHGGHRPKARNVHSPLLDSRDFDPSTAPLSAPPPAAAPPLPAPIPLPPPTPAPPPP